MILFGNILLIVFVVALVAWIWFSADTWYRVRQFKRARMSEPVAVSPIPSLSYTPNGGPAYKSPLAGILSDAASAMGPRKVSRDKPNVIRYKTRSGSVYEVLGFHVRRAVRSSISKAERVAEEFRVADSVECKGIGHPLVIVWGTGRDEHSANADQIGTDGKPDEAITRMTWTTPVIEIEHVG